MSHSLKYCLHLLKKKKMGEEGGRWKYQIAEKKEEEGWKIFRYVNYFISGYHITIIGIEKKMEGGLEKKEEGKVYPDFIFDFSLSYSRKS